MSARVAVLAFPGSCDDRDALRAVELVGAEPVRVWHADTDLGGATAVIVPGGFSYGDYLRPGALAALSPAMAAVRELAAAGGPVLGICNGFQVLTEAGLLPGVLRPNAHLKFRCHDVGLRVQRESAWLPGLVAGDVLEIPMKHHDGCFFATPAQLEDLDVHGQVLLRYAETPTARSSRSPASPTRPATWPASCRIPSTRSISCSARSTDASSCAACWNRPRSELRPRMRR